MDVQALLVATMTQQIMAHRCLTLYMTLDWNSSLSAVYVSLSSWSMTGVTCLVSSACSGDVA
jgi:hypothetical protein